MAKKIIKRPRRSEDRSQIVARNCGFCKEKIAPDWKKAEELRKFVSERGRILGADKTGLCAKHQRRLAKAIKQTRHLGLLPFVVGAK